jgi:hypothetical protein
VLRHYTTTNKYLKLHEEKHSIFTKKYKLVSCGKKENDKDHFIILNSDDLESTKSVKSTDVVVIKHKNEDEDDEEEGYYIATHDTNDFVVHDQHEVFGMKKIKKKSKWTILSQDHLNKNF